MTETPAAMPPQASRLEMEILNHYPGYGSFGNRYDSLYHDRRAFRTAGLSGWQLDLINQYPALYLSGEDMGIADYTHLAYGFEVGETFAPALWRLSEVGASLVKMLRLSGAQSDARISIVRVQEAEGLMKIRTTDNLQEPYRTKWRSQVREIEGCY